MDRSGASTPPPALDGVLVLELTTGIAGGFCGRLLAMLGADIVKLESSAHPDIARQRGPFPGDEPDPDRSGWHRFLHAQKRSVAVDVATEAGGRVLAGLAARADVLLDDGMLGRPPEVEDRYRALLAGNERLVVNAFSPYGLEGPKAAWASTELTDLAAGGWLQAAPPGREPLMPGTPCAHHATGVLGAFGVLLALAARRRTGRGQLVETVTTEALLSMLACPTSMYAMAGVDGFRMGDGYPYGIWPCADGHLGVSILTQAHYTGLCELMGRPDLAMHPVYRSGAERARPEVAAELGAIIAAWIADKPALATFEQGQARRVPIAIVPSPSEVLRSAQYEERGYWVDADDELLGPLRLPGNPFRSANGLFAEFTPAPLLGADTDGVLEWFGRVAQPGVTS